MIKIFSNHNGFSLIEVLVLIIVIGIVASTALQYMTGSIDDIRRIKTVREMSMLSYAIAGNPLQIADGTRADFGYIGDIGAFPPDLQALYQNPGAYATWDGPYIPSTFLQDSAGFKYDEWGTAYLYGGGISIVSVGSGSTITKKIADATSDYIYNQYRGSIFDGRGLPPGTVYADSVDVVITYPDGIGGLRVRTYQPDTSGAFTLDSLPVGRHELRIIYNPAVDTIKRYVTVLPRHRSSPPAVFKFAGGYFF